MSLTCAQFMEASRRWEEMDERLKRLIGFNPANSNHYGIIRLYNVKIDEKTTDDEIMQIRLSYIEWKQTIYDYCKRKNYKLTDDEFAKMFRGDVMWGTTTFCGITLDLGRNTQEYFGLVDYYFSKKFWN